MLILYILIGCSKIFNQAQSSNPASRYIMQKIIFIASVPSQAQYLSKRQKKRSYSRTRIIFFVTKKTEVIFPEVFARHSANILVKNSKNNFFAPIFSHAHTRDQHPSVLNVKIVHSWSSLGSTQMGRKNGISPFVKTLKFIPFMSIGSLDFVL